MIPKVANSEKVVLNIIVRVLMGYLSLRFGSYLTGRFSEFFRDFSAAKSVRIELVVICDNMHHSLEYQH
jgi:imidazoleglycerol phosphate dehydratase HisB